jgi:hypothetical protein
VVVKLIQVYLPNYIVFLRVLKVFLIVAFVDFSNKKSSKFYMPEFLIGAIYRIENAHHISCLLPSKNSTPVF